MMGGTLFRYFLRRHLLTIFWFVLGVTALIFLIDFINTSGLRSDVPGFTVFDGLFLTLFLKAAVSENPNTQRPPQCAKRSRQGSQNQTDNQPIGPAPSTLPDR